MFFDFQTETPVSINSYACLYSNSMICVHDPKESLKTQFICQLPQFFLWYLTVMQTVLLCVQTIFCELSDSLTQKYRLMVMM